MTFKLKLPSQSVEIELRTLDYYLWPASARLKAVALLSSASTRAKILSDLFPRERLVSMIELEQHLEEEFEADLLELLK